MAMRPLDDSVKWRPGQGAGEPCGPVGRYPWFWSCPGAGTVAERTDFRGGDEFDGKRWNDLHYTNAVKWAARAETESDFRVQMTFGNDPRMVDGARFSAMREG